LAEFIIVVVVVVIAAAAAVAVALRVDALIVIIFVIRVGGDGHVRRPDRAAVVFVLFLYLSQRSGPHRHCAARRAGLLPRRVAFAAPRLGADNIYWPRCAIINDDPHRQALQLSRHPQRYVIDGFPCDGEDGDAGPGEPRDGHVDAQKQSRGLARVQVVELQDDPVARGAPKVE